MSVHGLETEASPNRLGRFRRAASMGRIQRRRRLDTAPRLWSREKRFSRILSSGLLALMVWSTAAYASMPRMSVRGNRLYAGARPWRAWGMNWGVDHHAPVVAYFDNPTAARLATLRAELRTARRMGANSMRISLQLA